MESGPQRQLTKILYLLIELYLKVESSPVDSTIRERIHKNLKSKCEPCIGLWCTCIISDYACETFKINREDQINSLLIVGMAMVYQPSQIF